MMTFLPLNQPYPDTMISKNMEQHALTLTENEFLALIERKLGEGAIERINRRFVDRFGWPNISNRYREMRNHAVMYLMDELDLCEEAISVEWQSDFKKVTFWFESEVTRTKMRLAI